MSKFNLERIQSIIKSMNVDGWLLFDFRNSNDLALGILDMPANAHLSRRIYVYIPAEGQPKKVVNAIETHNLAHLPGEELPYASRQSLSEILASVLKDAKKIAMEYSAMNAIPYLSRVDAGTIEFIRSFGVEIVSSADLVTQYAALWSDEQYEENKPVAKALPEIVADAHNYIKIKLSNGEELNEFEVQTFILDEFEKRGYETDHDPIVAVNENAANPHYGPSEEKSSPIKEGDLLLIDLWARQQKPDGTWSDITRMGYVGKEVPQRFEDTFQVIVKARDAAFDLVADRFKEGKEVRGYEVDAIARKVISDAGFGQYFIHRTGHSITTEVHGSGAHMDDYETKDERRILPRTSFSIEPGIYIKGDFGVRTEIDVYVHEDGTVEDTGGERQYKINPIMAD